MNRDEQLKMACLECDTLQRVAWVAEGKSARCWNCGALLFHRPKGGLDRPIALMLGALVLYLVANLFPLVTLDINGLTQDTALIGTAWALYQHEMKLLAVVVFFTSVAAPGLIMASTLYVLLSLRFHLSLPGRRSILVFLSHLHPWEMADVFIISILVALVKLSGQAEVILDSGLYALVVSILLAIGARACIDFFVLWEMLDQEELVVDPEAAGVGSA